MQKIICIGSACKDVFFPTDGGKIIKTPEDILSQQKIEFELGAKYRIEDRYEALGGCAANVAVGLARLGTQVSCYSHIGNDQIADWILAELKKNNVGIDLVTKDAGFPSDMSAIIVDKNSAERVIFSNQKANTKLEIIPEKITFAEWIFVGDLHGDWQKDLDLISSVAEENKIKLAYNPRQSNIHDDVKKVVEIIAGTDVLFVNKDEALEILLLENSEQKTLPTGRQAVNSEKINNEEYLLGELKKLGAGIVVITDGVRGAWASAGGETFFVPGQKVNAVDSTGAGDAFASGFLASYLKEKTLRECLDWGIANSSNSVQFYGAIEGLMNEEGILGKTN
ncbi:MAG: carbohydrate kinase family protein [Candidatus Moranbacteria bacterium]|nr:carbohydrate kinase family protein [Candidatus Moranbacteria bacterium]